MLKDVLDVLGDRRMVLARELTKLFEDIRRGRVSEILSRFSTVKTKGEFVVILEGGPSGPPPLSDDDIRERLTRIWEAAGVSLRDAVYQVVQETGTSKNRVYDIAVKMSSGHDFSKKGGT